MNRTRLIGHDPGLRHTGWGIVDAEGNRLIWVADGSVASDPKASLAERLVQLHDGLQQVIADWQPQVAAIEETFVNRNPTSTLKLGQARGIAMLVPAEAGLSVGEYAPNTVKKTVVGVGHADKDQVNHMVRLQLPGVQIAGADAADALAIARFEWLSKKETPDDSETSRGGLRPRPRIVRA